MVAATLLLAFALGGLCALAAIYALSRPRTPESRQAAAYAAFLRDPALFAVGDSKARLSSKQIARRVHRERRLFREEYGTCAEKSMFPTLFGGEPQDSKKPDGTGVWDQERSVPLTFDDYVDVLMHHRDPRFRVSPEWVAWAYIASKTLAADAEGGAQGHGRKGSYPKEAQWARIGVLPTADGGVSVPDPDGTILYF
eukprot:m51a1_g2635 hypothetical protein (197) ;mRNA; f:581827-582591